MSWGIGFGVWLYYFSRLDIRDDVARHGLGRLVDSGEMRVLGYLLHAKVRIE